MIICTMKQHYSDDCFAFNVIAMVNILILEAWDYTFYMPFSQLILKTFGDCKHFHDAWY